MLRLGDAAETGLILNGGTISVPTLRMTGEGRIYVSAAGGAISSLLRGNNGLTKFGPGKLTLAGANLYTSGTDINSGILEAANTSASATGAGRINVNATGTLMITGGSAMAGSPNGTTVKDRGTVLLQGGTLTGPITMRAGSYLLGQGTIAGSGSVHGTIGSPTTDLDAPAYNGVEHIVFSNNSITFEGDSIYSWRLGALDDAPANAGTSWSLLHFSPARARSTSASIKTSRST